MLLYFVSNWYLSSYNIWQVHDDVFKWKHLPHYWPFVWGIHWSPMKSPHKGPWRGALMISLIWAWTNGWVNNQAAGDLRRHHVHYDGTLMCQECVMLCCSYRSLKEFCFVRCFSTDIIYGPSAVLFSARPKFVLHCDWWRYNRSQQLPLMILCSGVK